MTAAPRVLYHHRIRADDGQAVHVREMIAALRGRGCAVDECALVPKVEVASGSGAPARPAAGSFWQRLSLPRAAVEALEILYNGRGRAMLRAAAARSQPDFVYERHALHCRAGLDVALLPIGDNFTMGPDDALLALDFLKPKVAVPMHYNTWPPIAQDADAFAARAATAGHIVRALQAGQVLEV